MLRVAPTSTVAAGLLLVAGSQNGAAQLGCWAAAAAVDYLGPWFSHVRGFRVSRAHFVERFGQIILIALGESIVAIGVGAQGLPLDASVVGTALLGMCVIACLWWSYFDWVIYVARTRLEAVTGDQRAALARDGYSYLHLPMVGGIVLFAFGLKTALPDSRTVLPTVPAMGLFGGIALYFLAHVAVRLRIGGGFGRGRPAAAAVLLVLLPVTRSASGLIAVGLVAAVCVALIAYEALRHREARALIRARRGAPSPEESAGLDVRHRRREANGGPIAPAP